MVFMGVYGERDWVHQPTDGCPLSVGMPVHFPSVGVQPAKSFHSWPETSLKSLDHKSINDLGSNNTKRKASVLVRVLALGEKWTPKAPPPLFCFSSVRGPWAAMDVHLKTLRAQEDTW